MDSRYKWLTPLEALTAPLKTASVLLLWRAETQSVRDWFLILFTIKLSCFRLAPNCSRVASAGHQEQPFPRPNIWNNAMRSRESGYWRHAWHCDMFARVHKNTCLLVTRVTATNVFCLFQICKPSQATIWHGKQPWERRGRGRPWLGETDAQTRYCRYCSCSEDDVLSAPDPSVSRRDEGIPYPIVWPL